MKHLQFSHVVQYSEAVTLAVGGISFSPKHYKIPEFCHVFSAIVSHIGTQFGDSVVPLDPAPILETGTEHGTTPHGTKPY